MKQRRTASQAQPQRGNSLIRTLIGLTVGALVVLPIMYAVQTRILSMRGFERLTQELYTSDAAAEYGIWRVMNDVGFRDQITAAGTEGLQVAVPHQINNRASTIRVASLQQSFNYALWGDSDLCSSTLDWTGSGNRLIGNAHSNRGIKIQGAGSVIEGIVEYVTEAQFGNDIVFDPPPPDNPVQSYARTLPPLFYMSDYNDPTQEGTPAYAADAEGRYHYVDGDMTVNESGTVLDGLYLITGDLKLNGNDIGGTATFVVYGTTEVIGSGLQFSPYVDDLCFFATGELTGPQRCNTALIRIAGSGTAAFGGFIYAPHGLIRVSGSGQMAGAFVGDSIDLSGQGLTVELPELGATTEGCAIYDLIATAGATTTTVRFRYCGESSVQIQAWACE